MTENAMNIKVESLRIKEKNKMESWRSKKWKIK